VPAYHSEIFYIIINLRFTVDNSALIQHTIFIDYTVKESVWYVEACGSQPLSGMPPLYGVMARGAYYFGRNFKEALPNSVLDVGKNDTSVYQFYSSATYK
jgi:hypothetical protein